MSGKCEKCNSEIVIENETMCCNCWKEQKAKNTGRNFCKNCHCIFPKDEPCLCDIEF